MSTTPLITARQLDGNHDPIWGQGQGNYLSNVQAVAQIIDTRLLLFVGEWWASLTDGLPLWQSILGQGAGGAGQQQMANAITARIQGTPYVISVNNVNVTYNSSTRAFSYSATVSTQFGPIPIINYPIPTNGASL